MKQIQQYILFFLKAMVFVCLCCMSLVSVTDAVGRYFFNTPITGSTEIIELLMILVIFGSIPLVSQKLQHIRVDFFQISRSEKILIIQRKLIELLNAGVSFLLAYASWDKAKSLIDYEDMTQMLSIPLAPFMIIIMVLLVLNALIHLGNFFCDQERKLA